jgi:hypothetical protein
VRKQMTPEVTQAVEEIRRTFDGRRVDVENEDQGGAYVVVHDLSLGPSYLPATSWCGFLVTFQYPYADVYPHFIDGGLRRSDGRPLGEGFSQTTWRGRAAVQVSRRSNRWNAAVDTAVGKLLKVLEWIRTR